jgi:hypothetical protein
MKRLYLTLCATLIPLALTLPGVAQTTTSALGLGTSMSEFELIGQGSGTNTIQLSIDSANSVSFVNGAGQTVTCSEPGFILACGSASGDNSLSSGSNGSGAAYYVIWSPSQTPLTLTEDTPNAFAVTTATPVYFAYSSPQGTLQGTFDFDGAVMDSGTTAMLTGALDITGGSFASVFTTGQGMVSFEWAIGAGLSSIVGTNGSLTGQVDYPSQITTPPPSTCDFLTGGGWIASGSDHANFAVEGGCKHGTGWGQLNYIDHATGMHVKGHTFADCATGYQVQSNGPAEGNKKPTGCRIISGNAEINGMPGYTYSVTACDNGGSHGSDSFALSLSNGYSNSGTLQGGDVELHHGNQSFCSTCQTSNGKGNGKGH